MSQEKVDCYKKEKANRKQELRKQRIKQVVRNVIIAIATLALIGWLGYSAYDSYTSNKDRDMVSVNYDALDTYMGEVAE